VAPAELIAARALYTWSAEPSRCSLPHLAHLGTHAGARSAGRLFDAYRGYFQACATPISILEWNRIPLSRHAWKLFAKPAAWRAPPSKPLSRVCALNPGDRQPAHHAASDPGQLSPFHSRRDGAGSRTLSQSARPARPQFATFANNVDSTLYFLAAYLRGVPVEPAISPTSAKITAPAAIRRVHAERYELVNVEADRVTNSLNTLSMELIQWSAARKTATYFIQFANA